LKFLVLKNKGFYESVPQSWRFCFFGGIGGVGGVGGVRADSELQRRGFTIRGVLKSISKSILLFPNRNLSVEFWFFILVPTGALVL
jgi:hypothetical protein